MPQSVLLAGPVPGGFTLWIFFVFRVALEMIWYPVLLCLVVGIVLFFIRVSVVFGRRHKELERIKEKIAFSLERVAKPRRAFGGRLSVACI